jgi:hypothetical protein
MKKIQILFILLLIATQLLIVPKADAYTETNKSVSHNRWNIDGSFGAGILFLRNQPIFAITEEIGVGLTLYKRLSLRVDTSFAHIFVTLPYYVPWDGRSWYFFLDIGYQWRLIEKPHWKFDWGFLFSYSKTHGDDGPRRDYMMNPVAVGGGAKTYIHSHLSISSEVFFFQRLEVRYAFHLFDEVYHSYIVSVSTGLCFQF